MFLLYGVSGEDINLKSAFVHVAYDTISSVAVVVAVVIRFTGFHWLDPAVSMLIGVLILVWAARIVWDSVHILLESTPPEIDTEAIREEMTDVSGVLRVHDMHIWEITTHMYVMTAHVVVKDMPVAEADLVIEEVNRILREHHSIGHTTLQLEHGVSEKEEQATSPREWEQGGMGKSE